MPTTYPALIAVFFLYPRCQCTIPIVTSICKLYPRRAPLRSRYGPLSRQRNPCGGEPTSTIHRTSWLPATAQRTGPGSFIGICSSWSHRLPHSPRKPRRPLSRDRQVQKHSLHRRLRRRRQRPQTLEAGFTTVRDVGSRPVHGRRSPQRHRRRPHSRPAYRRLRSSISITGGHGDLNNYSPETTVTLFPDTTVTSPSPTAPSEVRKPFAPRSNTESTSSRSSPPEESSAKATSPGLQYTLKN